MAAKNPVSSLTVVELTRAIVGLPEEYRIKLAAPLAAVVESDSRQTEILGLVQEALQTLRTDIKYLMFDLEATRRERDEALLK